MRFAIGPAEQDRQDWRNKRHCVGGAAAEKTLIATMAGPVLRRRAVIVDVDAELRGVAEDRLEF